MKQFNTLRKLCLAIAMIGSASMASANDWKPANEGQMTDIPGEVDIETGVFTRNREDKDGIKDGHTDYMNTGGSILFHLYNDNEQKYKITFTASTNNNGASVTLRVYSDEADYDTPESGIKEVAISKAGWNTFNEYSVITDNALPEGNLTFVVDFNGGSNLKNFFFTEVSADTRKLTISATEGGKVTPASGDYSLNEEVVLTAYPDWGYDFTGWQDGEGTVLSTDNPYTITMDADKTVTGVFTQRSTTLVVPSDEVLDIAVGTLDRCEFAEQDGYDVTFNNVNAGATATYNIQVTADTEFQISFDAATSQDDVSLNFNILSGEQTVWSDDAAVTNNGNWHSGYATYTLRSDEIPAGDYTLVITFNSPGRYTANVANLKMQDANDTTTAIQQLKHTADSDAPAYNLGGQRVANPVKGIYVKGAKKYIVK